MRVLVVGLLIGFELAGITWRIRLIGKPLQRMTPELVARSAVVSFLVVAAVIYLGIC